MKPLEKRLIKLEAEAPDHDDVTKLSEAELRRCIEAIQGNFVQRERDGALAKGEDISRLDDIDFLIRFMRRAHADHPQGGWDHRISKLVKEAVPDVSHVHAQPCSCFTCINGETHPIRSYEIVRERRRAWLHRYMPESEAA